MRFTVNRDLAGGALAGEHLLAVRLDRSLISLTSPPQTDGVKSCRGCW
jgi:hypothetical protein